MAIIPVYNKERQEVEKFEFDEIVFGDKVHKKLLREYVVMYEANQRSGTACTKSRGEVEGSTRKPWRQKHTGRARIGTIRSPIWRHGGIAHGPKPRNYHYHIPKKMRQIANSSAILDRIINKQLILIDSLSFPKPKTKELYLILKKLRVLSSCCIGVLNYDKNIFLSARNIPNIDVFLAEHLNAYAILKREWLLMTKEALQKLIEKRTLVLMKV